MDISDKLLDTSRSLSKTSGLALLAVMCITAYLLQRSLGVFLEVATGFSLTLRSLSGTTFNGSDLTRPQTGLFGLSFSFGSMTLFWPVVLGFFCVACNELVHRNQRVRRKLLAMVPADPSLQSLLDPFTLTAESTCIPDSSFAWKIVKQAPRLSMIVHFISELTIAATVARGGPLTPGSSTIVWFRDLNPAIYHVSTGTGLLELVWLIPHLSLMSVLFLIGWRWVSSFPNCIDVVRATVTPCSGDEGALVKEA